MRGVRLIISAPYLAAWLDRHPRKGEPEAPLWALIDHYNQGQFAPYDSLARYIRVLARKAQLRKRVHPHLFRHSRATALADKLTEAQLKEMFGWTQSSRQAATYVHLSGRNVDDALLKLYGLGTGSTGYETRLTRSTLGSVATTTSGSR